MRVFYLAIAFMLSVNGAFAQQHPTAIQICGESAGQLISKNSELFEEVNRLKDENMTLHKQVEDMKKAPNPSKDK